jgi:hypothetical protein
MNDRANAGQEPAEVGLCALCRHAQIIRSDRGQSFFMCLRSRTNPAFPRYPALPVLTCVGYEPAAAAPDGTDE